MGAPKSPLPLAPELCADATALQAWLLEFSRAIRDLEQGQGTNVEAVLGPNILRHYDSFVPERSGSARADMRARIIDGLLARLRTALAYPKQWYEVRAKRSASEAGTVRDQLLVEAARADTPVLCPSHWLSWYRQVGLGFRAENSALHQQLGDQLLRACLHRFSESLAAVPGVLDGLGLKAEIRARPTKVQTERVARLQTGDPDGARFELLMMWVLDDGEGEVRPAGLREDLLEATDIRYLPSTRTIERWQLEPSRRGLRIQVTRSVGQGHLEHKRRLAQRRRQTATKGPRGRAKGYAPLWLSPRTLAEFVLAESETLERLLLADSSLGQRGLTVEALGHQLRDLLVRASLHRAVSLAGLPGQLPEPLLRIIRDCVHHQAAKAVPKQSQVNRTST